MDWQSPALTAALEAWLAEDIGRGDLTAAALQGQQGQAHWVAKQPGRFCGGPLVQRLFQRLDPGVSLRLLRQDGDAVEAGDCLLELQGPANGFGGGGTHRLEPGHAPLGHCHRHRCIGGPA